MTTQEVELIRQLIERINRLERRIALADTLEQGETSATNIAATVHAATLDATPLDADEVPGLDSSASFALLRWTWTSIKAFLKTYWDTLYAPIAKGVTNGDTHDHSGGDGNQIDHGGTGGLSDDDHAQYALLAGRAGGQTLEGGTGSGDALKLSGSNHATKGGVRVIGDKVIVGVDATPAVQMHLVSETTVATRGLLTAQHTIDAAAATVFLRKSRGSFASPATVVNGDFIGMFAAQVYDGTAYLLTAAVAYKSNGTVATSSVPTDLIFTAGATDDPNLTNERMRVTSAGNVVVGAVVATGKLHVDQSSSTAAIPVIVADQADLSEEFIEFVATVGAGNPIDTAALGAYYGKIRVSVNGTFKYIGLYDS